MITYREMPAIIHRRAGGARDAGERPSRRFAERPQRTCSSQPNQSDPLRRHVPSEARASRAGRAARTRCAATARRVCPPHGDPDPSSMLRPWRGEAAVPYGLGPRCKPCGSAEAKKALTQMKADARETRRWFSVVQSMVYNPWTTRLISRRGLPKLSSKQSCKPVALR